MSSGLDPRSGIYAYLVAYFLTHHYLCDSHFKELQIYDELAYDFMRLKWDCRKRISYFDINLISLGENCLPLNLLTKWGLVPTLNQSRFLSEPFAGRLPFDKAVHSVKLTYQLLSTRFQNYHPNSTIYCDGQTRFAIKSPNYYASFLHDEYDLSRNVSDNFNEFSKILQERALRLLARVQKKPTIFLLNCTSKSGLSYIPQLRDLLRSVYKAELIIVSEHPAPDDIGSTYFRYTLPWAGYEHFNVQHWLTNEGFDFEYKIINFVLQFVESHYPVHTPVPIPAFPRTNLYTHVAQAYASQKCFAEANSFLQKALENISGFDSALWLTTFHRCNKTG